MSPLAQWHRYFGLAIAVQLLLWLLSGLWFSLMDGDTMRGGSYRVRAALTAPPPPLPLPTLLARLAGNHIDKVEYVERLGQSHFRVFIDGQAQLFDGQQGQPLQLTKAQIATLATNSYRGPGQLAPPQWQATPQDSILSAAWRINSNDKLNTRIYVSRDGQVLGHRNRFSTLNRWAFAVHFADYPNGRDFNHTLIYLLAALFLGFVGTGIALMVQKLRLGYLAQRPLISAVDGSGQLIAQWRQRWGQPLLSSDLPLAGRCRGQGQCGQCRVSFSDGQSVLACQHYPAQPTQLRLSRKQQQKLPH
ncbi:PepSY domain-containing protein [uncultured Ferrimonas sp.]|uniref:PepSY domain-containing protein n=1 Tax=uncultured Ferrimonas sp. TaxID=432640 RepID=UPI002621B42E|nr:PepSY domain-containing protein [uncultured Ferrimonas sp.]